MIDDELVEPLVTGASASLAIRVKRFAPKRDDRLAGRQGRFCKLRRTYARQRLNVARVVSQLPCAFLEYEVRPHAALREFPHAVRVFGAIRTRVEMPRAVVA